jgi:hypothetical protein
MRAPIVGMLLVAIICAFAVTSCDLETTEDFFFDDEFYGAEQPQTCFGDAHYPLGFRTMGLGGCRLLTIATTSAMLMRLMRRRRCLWSGWRLGRGNGRALGWVARILECLLVFRMRRELLGREHHRAIAVRPFVVLLGSQRIGSNRRRGLEWALPPVDFRFCFPRLSLRPPL